MRTLRYTSILLALAVLLAAAGCGGGGGGSTESTAKTERKVTPTLTKAALISQGDAICAEVNAAVGSVGAAESGVANQVTQVSDLYIGMVESIRRLGTPKEDAGYAEFIAAAEALAKVEGEAKLAAEREDSAALGEAATRAAPALEAFETAAIAYGFEACGEGPSAPTAPVTGGGAPSGEEEGGVEAAPEATEEPEYVEPEAAPETGGAGGAGEEAAPEGGGAEGGESGGGSGGVGPG